MMVNGKKGGSEQVVVNFKCTGVLISP